MVTIKSHEIPLSHPKITMKSPRNQIKVTIESLIHSWYGPHAPHGPMASVLIPRAPGAPRGSQGTWHPGPRAARRSSPPRRPPRSTCRCRLVGLKAGRLKESCSLDSCEVMVYDYYGETSGKIPLNPIEFTCTVIPIECYNNYDYDNGFQVNCKT